VPATVVEYDNEGGAYAMTAYLLANGHRKIAYVGREPGLSTTDERVRGYRRAHADHGVAVDEGLIPPGTFTRESGAAVTEALWDERGDATAVFAATDMVAAGVLKALRGRGVRVPEDVSVVGFDDIPLASDLTPALTTVHVPHEQLGREAVRLALHRGPDLDDRVVLGTHIVVRDSAAPLRP
jgi:LacI family transcriptional regulator